MEQGQTVTLKVRNSLYHARNRYANSWNGPEFEEYTGTLVNVSHFNGDVGLTTGDPCFPIRRIAKHNVVEVNSSQVDFTPVVSETVTKTVTGSKGQTYVVTITDGKATCTCPGFSFRKTCKHIASV